MSPPRVISARRREGRAAMVWTYSYEMSPVSVLITVSSFRPSVIMGTFTYLLYLSGSSDLLLSFNRILSLSV